MYTYMYIYVYMYTCAYVCVHVCTYTHSCTYVFVGVHSTCLIKNIPCSFGKLNSKAAYHTGMVTRGAIKF